MIRKNNILILTLIIISIVLTGCAPEDNHQSNNNSNLESIIQEKDEQISQLENRISELEADLSDEGIVYTRVLNTLLLIKNNDMQGLSAIVHPTKGLRFTPYDYIDLETDRVFSAEEVARLNENNEIYTWGVYDGIGDPIELNFNEYYERFIYDYEFAQPHIIGINNIIGQGNTINNVVEAYPDGKFVEFHITGLNPEFVGMDWRSLRLVFEELDGELYLVGMIHGEWTI